jgi:hypothetical protein
LIEILIRLVAKNPEDRFSSAGDLAVALEQLAQGACLPELASQTKV